MENFISDGGRVFTTGQIAKMIRTTPRTVSKWMDSGKLRGYRLPESSDRRVQVSDLIEFLCTRNIPLPLALQAVNANVMMGVMTPEPPFPCRQCASLFEFGVSITRGDVPPSAVILTDQFGTDVMIEAAIHIRRTFANRESAFIVGVFDPSVSLKKFASMTMEKGTGSRYLFNTVAHTPIDWDRVMNLYKCRIVSAKQTNVKTTGASAHGRTEENTPQKMEENPQSDMGVS